MYAMDTMDTMDTLDTLCALRCREITLEQPRRSRSVGSMQAT
jgi:hypothetical protein